MRIAVIHSNARFLMGPRLPLLRHLRTRGEVVAMAPGLRPEQIATLAELGMEGVSFRLSPTGMNPMTDVVDTFRLARRLRRLRLDAVLTNTVKPVTLGTFAARLAGVKRRYALISGLGFAFVDDGAPPDARKRLVRRVVTMLYRRALAMNDRVIFHNRDDMREFVDAGICPPDVAAFVNGSGVETREFAAGTGTPHPTFICVSRLLRDKGILEYLEAARIVKARLPSAEFLLLGDIDSNPSAVDPREVQRYVEDGTIEWGGLVDDVRPWLSRASVFVLPSYREGIPRSTLEAMALGLAVITTDAPGCRETVIDGENGLLVPVRDVASLASAMEALARDPERSASMGRASRRIAETTFDTQVVHKQLDELLGW